MDTDALIDLGEYFAAGVFEQRDATMVECFALGLLRWAEHLELPRYGGEFLYPTGGSYWRGDMAVGWYYVSAHRLNDSVFERKYASADLRGQAALCELRDAWSAHKFPAGYTHSIPHYGRVLSEGLDGYAARVRAGLEHASDDEQRGFYRAMQTTLEAARTIHRRVVSELDSAVCDNPVCEQRRRALLDAYARVPFAPAETFIEAATATNFLFYFDGCDNLGRYDQYLGPCYERDVAAGRISREIALDVARQQWKNVDDAVGWNVAIGGTTTDGQDLSSEFTIVCIEAARGRRRPNLALRLGEGTPDSIWEAALDTIETGCGLPALYWDPNYFAAMDESGIPLPDLDKEHYAFGGCTELMVHGRSFVGSLDSDVNLPAVLTDSVEKHLPGAESFDAFCGAFRQDIAADIERMAREVNRWQREKAVWQPQPVRSLLVDDCIERGVEYSAGGARYNWSVINVVGLANAIDSLSAIQDAVFESGDLSAGELVGALAADFKGTDALHARLSRAPRYGNGDPATDALANEFSSFVFDQLLSRRCWRGGPFVPSCLMFVTYAWYGEPVGATADGRRAGAPVADSAGPYQGRDVSGPTAMLRSTASLDQRHAPGTLVVNLRLGRQHFRGPVQREKTKALIRSYFEMGGLQLQVNVIDQKTLEDAVAHPEKYGDLIVRVGGYSEYWRNLGPELRESILLRTEH